MVPITQKPLSHLLLPGSLPNAFEFSHMPLDKFSINTQNLKSLILRLINNI